MTSSHQILIVDDNPDCADSVRELVGACSKWNVAVAYDPRDACLKATQQPPDVVLMDLEMPGMDGFELAQQLLAGMPPKVPKLVALTGNEEQWRRAAEDERFECAFIKPMGPKTLMALLEGFDSALADG